jgi:hypothetical protein
MDVCEPRVRRRGMFFQVETLELDAIETESAEGIPARIARPKPTQTVRTGTAKVDEAPARQVHGAGNPPRPFRRTRARSFRFATATGSRRLSQMTR